MMSALVIGIACGFMMLAMAGAFLVQRRTGQSGWIDAIWSISTAITAIFLLSGIALAEGSFSSRSLLALGMILIWGVRLSAHIAVRTKGAGDDPRYRALRESWGARADRRLFLFLQVQALCALPLAISVALAGARPGPDAGRAGFCRCRHFRGRAAGGPRWRIDNSQRTGYREAARFVIVVCGVTHAIPTISSNGLAGAPGRSWRRHRSPIR